MGRDADECRIRCVGIVHAAMYRLEAVLQTVMPLVVCIFWSCIAQNIFAADRELGNSTVREATINPRLTHLPIIDGYDVRFARFYNVQGPSISNVGPFAQDDQGFIWFGTPNGLDRVDGFTFKVFSPLVETPARNERTPGRRARAVAASRSAPFHCSLQQLSLRVALGPWRQ